MNTETIRLNITLPKELVHEMDNLFGTRKRSQFISDAIRQLIQRKQKEKMKSLLEEGYQARAKESLEITKEFQAIDMENWDDY